MAKQFPIFGDKIIITYDGICLLFNIIIFVKILKQLSFVEYLH